MVESFASRATILPRLLGDNATLRCQAPKGGIFCMVDVSGTGVAGETFAWTLLEEERVAVMPGSSFGKQMAAYIRVSLTADPHKLREAAKRILNLAHRLTDRRRHTRREKKDQSLSMAKA